VLTQERQLLDVNHGFVIPKELTESGFQKEYETAMNKAKEVFLKLKKILPIQAQYVVPLGFRIRWYMKMNAREVCHLTELRASPQGHPAYRKVAQEMFKKVRAVHPNIAEFMKFIDMKDYDFERLEAEKRLDKKMEDINKKYGS
jgi:thymidylate synthase ThyX